MSLFQFIAIPLLLLLVVSEARAYLRNHQRIHVVRLLVWLSAGVFISLPELSSQLATVLGIGRGADLVLYGFVLFGTAFGFHLYGRQVRLRRDLVALARRDAIANASAGERSFDPVHVADASPEDGHG